MKIATIRIHINATEQIVDAIVKVDGIESEIIENAPHSVIDPLEKWIEELVRKQVIKDAA